MAKSIKSVETKQFIQKTYIQPDMVNIKLTHGTDPNLMIDELQRCFDELFNVGIYLIIFDMKNIEFPNGSFISMLIGKTSEARRWGGDLRLINLSDSVKQNLSIFTPLTYLTIGKSGDLSLYPLGELFPSLNTITQDLIEGKSNKLHVSATIDSMNQVTDFVTDLAQQAGIEKIELSKMKIAVYEACMNVIEHGYHYEPGNMMGVEVLLENSTFKVTITDTGESFDFYEMKHYDVETAFEEKRRGGYGLYIIQKSVDEVKYKTDRKKGNRLTLIKKLNH